MDSKWIRIRNGAKKCRFFQPFFLIHPLSIHYPLRIRIHYESIFHYVSVYPSIIHHVSLSIILSRLRIHSHGPPALLLFVVCLLGPWAHFGPGPILALGPIVALLGPVAVCMLILSGLVAC